MEFSQPVLDYAQLWPMIVVLAAACVGVVVEAFVPRGRRFWVQVGLAAAGLVAALVGTVVVGTGLDVVEGADGGAVARGLVTAGGTVAVDGPTVFLWGLILALALAGLLLFAERRLEGGVSGFAGQAAALPGSEAEREASAAGLEHTEVYPLLMFAVGGMMLFPAANDLLTMFVALEVLSLPLYLLCGLARRRRLLSQEAAMKYFLLGAFSSGFLIYGIALVYGYAGSMQFGAINEAVRNGTDNDALLLTGIALVAVGLLFKVGAAPFQAWTPDVYQGAPTAVTAFMSAATKVAAFGAMLRLFYVAFGAERWSWQPMMWAVAILTMVLGAVLAITQDDVKRMLAYSAVAHTGFLLTGVLGLQGSADVGADEVTSVQAVMFYLVAYGFASLGAFAIVTLVRDSGGEATHLSRWSGLGKASPVVAAAFAVLLISMAGLPLTSGFIGKWSVFTAALAAGAWPVVVIAVLTSVVAAFFYVRVIVLMYFADPVGDGPTVAVPSVLTAIAIAFAVAVTVVLGLLPGPVLDLAGHAGQFLR